MVPWWVTAVNGWRLLWKGDPVVGAVLLGLEPLLVPAEVQLVAQWWSNGWSFGGSCCLSWFMWLLWLLCVDFAVNVT